MFRPNNSLFLPEALQFPYLTTKHASNHWSTDKMITLLIIIDGEVLIILLTSLVPIVKIIIQGSLFALPLDTLNFLTNHFIQFPLYIDKNMLHFGLYVFSVN